MKRRLIELVNFAYSENKRLVAPLLGFPGIKMVGSSIKLAQQNYGEHYRVLKKLVDEFNPDVIFTLMDLSVEANALGRYTIFPKDEWATVPKDKFNFKQLESFKDIDIKKDGRLSSYVKTVELMSLNQCPNIKVGAYVTGPYTLAGLIMGAEETALATSIDPENLNKLCNFTTKQIIKFMNLLIAAGAGIICILEPGGVMLGPEKFQKFSSHYVKQIVEIYNRNNVDTIYHVCGDSMHLINRMVESGVDGLSLDSEEVGVNLSEVGEKVPDSTVLMSNINSTGVMLNGNPSEVKEKVENLLKSMDAYPNFVLSTGCDLPLETPLENIRIFMETGRKHRINKNLKS